VSLGRPVVLGCTVAALVGGRRLRCAGRLVAAFLGLFEFDTRLRPVVPRVDVVFAIATRQYTRSELQQ
jgi:hypothetical protein